MEEAAKDAIGAIVGQGLLGALLIVALGVIFWLLKQLRAADRETIAAYKDILPALESSKANAAALAAAMENRARSSDLVAANVAELTGTVERLERFLEREL